MASDEFPQRWMLGIDQSPIVAMLDALDADDPEHAHSAAERVMLDALGPEVSAAYDRLVARASWWASA